MAPALRMTTPALSTKGGGRFHLRKQLGEGGFGVVFEALDTRRNAIVALKTLRRFDSAALFRFKQEFRSFADVDHPNVVSLHELFADGDEWFFTMELIAGSSFTDYVWDRRQTLADWPQSDNEETRTTESPTDQSPPPPASRGERVFSTPLDVIDRLRAAAGQVAQALHEIHSMGILHRDIKPSNVLVTPQGRAVILDFGLVTQLTDHGRELAKIIGTPAYMSPEQSIGHNVAAASDWYSVGVMLYQALTGHVPFSGSTTDVLLAKQITEPPAPISLAPGIPDDLNDLCIALLRRDPASRPTGVDVLRRLAVAASPQHSRISSPLRRRPLVGRASHLEALDRSFAAADDRAVIAWVQGPSGIGKSTLIRQFLAGLVERHPTAVILAARCHQQESVPYKAIDGLVDQLAQYLGSLSDLEAALIVPRDAASLARLFPVLRELPAVSAQRSRVAEGIAAQEVRRRAFAALRDLLGRLGDQRPLVLHIDDLQWGDRDSSLLLTELLRPPDPPALLLIGSYRSEDRATSPLLETLITSLGQPADGRESRTIEVGHLTGEEAMALALDVLGDHPNAVALAAAAARDGAGNAFLVEELARRALESGDLVGLEQAVQSRVATLGADARRLIELLSVSGQPLDETVAASAFEGDLHSVVRQLRARRLVRSGGTADSPALETYHDRIREAVVASLDPDVLRDRHACLAAAWEASGRADPEVLLTHYQGCGNRERAAEYALKAASVADESFAFERAARLYRLALELGSVSGRDAGLLRARLGQALANAGHGPEAGEVFLAALADVDPAEQPDIERRAAEQFLRFGHLEQGLEVLDRLLRRFGMQVASTPRRALISVIIRSGLMRLRGTRFKERHESQIDPKQLLQLDTCWSAAGGLGMADIIRGYDLQLRHLLLALKVGEPRRIGQALATHITNAVAEGASGVARGRALSREALALADRLEDPLLRGHVLLGMGVAAKLEGRCHDCAELMQQTLDQLESCVGVAWERQMGHMFIIESLAWTGDWQQQRRRLAASLVDAEQHGDRYFLTYLRARPSALARLADDDPDGAIEQTRVAMAGWAAPDFDLPHWYAFYMANQARLYAGRSDLAWASLSETLPAVKKSFLLFTHVIRVELFQLRGRLALDLATTHASRRLLAAAERDARRLTKENMAWSTALGTAIQAGVEAVRGRRDAAIGQLAAAERLFVDHRMAMCAAAAARARGLMLGGSEGQRLVSGADELMTAQRVANPARMARMLVPGPWN